MLTVFWENVGIVGAVLCICACLSYCLSSVAVQNLQAFARCARKTPFRATLGAVAVGILVAYGGSKPTPKTVEFDYTETAAGIVLTGIRSYPDSFNLKIPETYDSKTVTALAGNFCAGETNFTSVTISRTVTSIGDGFFTPPADGKRVKKIEVAAGNPYCAVTKDGVLYELAGGQALYACTDVTEVRFRVEYVGASPARTDYKLFGQPLTLAANICEKSGYEQVGWARSSSAAKADYEPEALYLENSDIRLYPVWKELPVPESGHIVVFDPNGDGVTGTMSNQVFKLGMMGQPLDRCLFARPGYLFAGWSLGRRCPLFCKDGEGLGFEMRGTTKLYAVWIACGCYAVDYVLDEADGEFSAVDRNMYEPGRVYSLKSFPPQQNGHRLVGWKCSNGKRYDDGVLVFDLAKPGETVTMTAIWK